MRVERATGLRLVRRCPDVADLLAASASGVAGCALVSADLPGLDREVLGRLAADGCHLVGVYAAEDEEAQRRLHQLGVACLLVIDAEPADWSRLLTPPLPRGERGATCRDGVHDPSRQEGSPDQAGGVGDFPGGWPPEDEALDAVIDRELRGLSPSAQVGVAPLEGLEGAGNEAADEAAQVPHRVIAVWGPTGAPGRTTVAVNLAAEIARLGRSVLLVDADTYGASVAQHLALLDEAPGTAAAVRLADQGRLDLPALAAVAPEAVPGLRVLTGIPRPDRWTELREDAFAELLRQCRALAQVTVVDVGFCLEEDEELSYDTRAPRRNATTTLTLRHADEVVAVGSGDPVGLQRLVRGLDELKSFTSRPRVVVTKVRATAVGPAPEQQVREALARFAGIREAVLVRDDRPALDVAMLAGRTLAESAPGSPARRALAQLAGDLLGVEVAVRRRGLRRACRGRASTR